VSRYFTKTALRKKPIAMASTNNSVMKTGRRIQLFIIGTWLISAIKKRITKFRDKLIRADNALLMTTKYRGILIFFIRSPRETIDVIAELVASAKKFHRMMPRSKYTA